MFDFEIFSNVISVYALFSVITSCFGIALFILQGVGLYEFSKKLNFNKPWLCFIPIVSTFALGRVGDCYFKNNGKKAKSLKIWLFILAGFNFLILAVFLVVLAVLLFQFIIGVSNIISANDELTTEIFKILIPIAVFYFMAVVTSIVYRVLYYITLWRIFTVFDNRNAVVYLVLSVFFGFLAPIFIFAIRKKEPKFTMEERMGISSNG